MRKGFSLVELSIVLVILGLLVGGILAGKSLIRASEMRAVTTEYNRYATAIRAFRDRYFAFPGDMDNAVSFWGTFAGCTDNTTAATGTQTCNGNANKLINAGKEGWAFWQHLANAGLIEGTYNGIPGAGNVSWDAVIGSNVPASKIANVGWTALSIAYSNDSTTPAVGGDLGGAGSAYIINQLLVGKEQPNYWTNYGFLLPEELWNIDTKIDDGKPGVGLLVANNWNTCTNAASAAAAATGTPDYRLTTTTQVCSIIFMPQGTGLQ